MAVVPKNETPSMFSKIARRYDLLNHVLSLGIDRRWRRDLVRMTGLQDGGRVLDAGDLAVEDRVAVVGAVLAAVVVRADDGLGAESREPSAAQRAAEVEHLRSELASRRDTSRPLSECVVLAYQTIIDRYLARISAIQN